ncbi:condensation domain-containing protein [Xenorhabdus sp. SGI246]|uniref:condensation domain-containing protein n=1 Tax=Xenorhabdus sp. SGI246 TaxID=3158263 RepID=UPI00349F4D46
MQLDYAQNVTFFVNNKYKAAPVIYANSTYISLSPYQRDIWVKAALINAAEKTDTFRLRFNEEDGTPYQWVDKEFEYQVTLIYLTHQADSTSAAESWLQNAFSHSYKLNDGSFVDFTLLRTTESVYVHVRTHHIVSDAWSLQMRLVAVGVIGKIYTDGGCLAKGYRGSPELTEEHFLPHLWRVGVKLYRTGDLGRVLDNGSFARNLYFRFVSERSLTKKKKWHCFFLESNNHD